MYQDIKIFREKGIKMYLNNLSSMTVKPKKYTLKSKLLIETLTNVLELPLIKSVPVDMLAGMYTIAFVENVFKNRIAIPYTKLYRDTRERIGVAKKIRKKSITRVHKPSVKLFKITLSLLEGFGLIHIVYYGKRYGIVLTELGNVTKNFIANNAKEFYRLPGSMRTVPILLPGVLFPTKARLIYYLLHSAGRIPMDWYKLLRTKAIRNELIGHEKTAFEIMRELELVNYGAVKGYCTQTQLLLSVLESIDKYPGYNYTRSLMNRIMLRRSSILDWPEAKTEGVKVDEVLSTFIERLLTELKTNEEKIEDQLILINGFP